MPWLRAAAATSRPIQPPPTTTLGNCPFHRLAQQFTQLVCGLNLELLRGIADGADDTEHTMLLDPAPSRCCVRIVPSSDDESLT